MMRLIRLFSDSLEEFRSLRNLTLMAMLLAVSVALSFYSIQPFPYLKISFQFLPLAAIGMMFGPSAGFLAGTAGDLVGFLIKPTGAFNPLITLVAGLGGMFWGLFLYKNRAGLLRVILARLSVTVVCNLVCTTAILCLFFGSVLWEILPLRILKNLCAFPVEVALAYAVCRILLVIRKRVRLS